MSFKSLTPVEKRRLDRSIQIVSKLANKSSRSEIDLYAMRERTRVVLKLLGSKHPSRVDIARGIDILKDFWPFKVRRLRKLIDGRRRQ